MPPAGDEGEWTLRMDVVRLAPGAGVGKSSIIRRYTPVGLMTGT